MQFGLQGSPATMQRLMTRVFRGLLFESALVYIDDILVYSRYFPTHLRDLQTVFDRLRSASLKLHPSKCNWAMQKLNYLELCLSSEGLSPYPKKTEAINTFPRPKNQKELQRRFIRGFAKIATSLHHLLGKNVLFQWSPACEEVFLILKHTLCTALCLIFAEANDSFFITTDSSDFAIGFVISQEKWCHAPSFFRRPSSERLRKAIPNT